MHQFAVANKAYVQSITGEFLEEPLLIDMPETEQLPAAGDARTDAVVVQKTLTPEAGGPTINFGHSRVTFRNHA